MTVLCVILANCLPELLAGYSSVVVPCIILALLCAVCVIIIWRQPESKEALTFKVTFHFLEAQDVVVSETDWTPLAHVVTMLFEKVS